MKLITHSTRHLDEQTMSAFIDAELSTAEDQRVREHLTECKDCALRVLSATDLKNASARAGRRFAPPPEAFARVTAHLRSSQAKTKTDARVYSFRPMAWAAIAAAVLLAVSLLSWHQFRQNDTVAAELLDQHLATLSTSAVPQVVSSDKHTVKPWFQGRLPFSFNLPEAATLPPATVLNGADLAYFNGQPAALLLFTVRKHQVSVWLVQRTAEPALMKLPENRAGFTIHSATASGLRIIAVSDVNPADLDRLVEVLAQTQGAP
jgi:anti-sigma factor RsiW